MVSKTTSRTAKVDYSIDRKTAAKLLKVSVRTLDRYIRSEKLSTKRDDGRIWLSKSEIIGFRADYEEKKARRILDRKDMEKSIEIIDKIGDDTVSKLSSHDRPLANMNENVYQKLYDEAKKELQEQRKRLEGANYRVGQLEAELKGTIPLLDYQQSQAKFLEAKDDLKLRTEKVKKELFEAQKQYRIEKYNKFIYLSILFILLALQPLWLVFVGK